MFVDWQLFRRRALWLAMMAMALVFIIWNIPQLDFILYPFRLFVTFVHEAGHGLAAIATGGRFVSFEVMANGSGLATTRGGLRAVILPAGYIGSAVFGAGLLYITNRIPYPRLIAFGVGAALVALSLLYGQTSQVALTVGVAFGIALGLMGLILPRYFIVFVLNLLAITTALNAVLDLLFLTRNTTATTPDGRVLNDAAAFTLEITPGLSPDLWAWVWALLSVAVLGMAIYLSIVRPILTDAVINRRYRSDPPTEPDGAYYEYHADDQEYYG
jgi:hypothetical protein